MKCSGGPVPPCDRCRKANSPCLFEPPSQQNHHQHLFTSHHLRLHYDDIYAGAPPPNLYLDPQPVVPVHPVGAHIHRDAPPASTPSPQQTSPNHRSATATAASGCPALPVGAVVQPLSQTELVSTERSLPSPAASTESPARKRRRTCSFAQSGDSPANPLLPEISADPGSSTAASSPYEIVRDFEVANRRPGALTDSHNCDNARSCPIQADAGLTGANVFTCTLDGRRVLSKCLAAVDLCHTDARDMFVLFGDRVAPFIPWLYDQDFTDLPDDPLFALSCIHVMARYLPGVSRLRSGLEAILISLLQQVTFDDLERPYEAVLETFKGLGVVYGYSEVGVASSVDNVPRPKLDALSVKGIIEGYAVRWNIGKAHPSNAMGCTLWLWLYTMST